MSQCITIVRFDTEKRTKVDAIAAGKKSAPTYRELATKGLIRKDFLNGDSGGGGVYLWESREAAQDWFTQERIAWLAERFGVRPTILYYDTYVTVDNKAGEIRVTE
ncbi:MAG: monooxygenase [Gammaproteobacteria bacterium]|nr:monooxygenase [Gammaproteobacteria bacterium]